MARSAALAVQCQLMGRLQRATLEHAKTSAAETEERWLEWITKLSVRGRSRLYLHAARSDFRHRMPRYTTHASTPAQREQRAEAESRPISRDRPRYRSHVREQLSSTSGNCRRVVQPSVCEKGGNVEKRGPIFD